MRHEPMIRPIRAEEAPEVKRLIYTVAHPLMEPHMTWEAFIEQWEAWGVLADLDDIQHNYFDQDGIFLVIEIDSRIIGTGAIKRYTEGQLFEEGGRLRTSDQSLITGEGLCEIRRIALLPEFRGQKLGCAIMLDLIRRAHELGYTRMMLWTDPIKLHHAVAFYHRLGFTDLPIEGIDEDELWLGMKI